MSNDSNREVEKKYTIRGLLLDDVYDILLMLIPPTTIEYCINPCETIDYYWKAPENSTIQFIRLRDSWGRGSHGFSQQLQEITVKAKDKVTNLDRLEHNLNIKEPRIAKNILNLLFGPSELLQKEECVIFIKELGASGHVVISLAHIKGERQVYLEVEAQSEEIIDLYVKKLSKKLEMLREEKSFYELYIEWKF